jgi:uncharacterized membrane protein
MGYPRVRDRLVVAVTLLVLGSAGQVLAAALVEVPATFGGASVTLEGLSGDGQVLVGNSSSAAGTGLRWTQSSGWQSLGAPAGNTTSRVRDVSFDGLEATGNGNQAGGARRWVQGSGWGSDLFPGTAAAISADGSAVAGTFRTIIFPDAPVAAAVLLESTLLRIWKEGVGTTSQLAADPYWSFIITGITADGSEVIGNREGILGHAHVMRFAASGGGVMVPFVPDGMDPACGSLYENPCVAHAYAVTPDGSVLVGSLELRLGEVPPRAARWIGNAGPTFLSGSPAGLPSEGRDVTADGGMIVGNRQGHAFVWTPAGSMHDLKQLLEDLGLDLTGWTLVSVFAMSDDGSVVVGTGTRPGGASAIWLVQAPELEAAAQVPEPIPALGAWGGAVLGLALAAAGTRSTRRDRRQRRAYSIS